MNPDMFEQDQSEVETAWDSDDTGAEWIGWAFIALMISAVGLIVALYQWRVM